MRTLAIGDIHGCRASLDHLLAFVAPKPGETIVTLGDYIDRGPDSAGVLDRLIEMHGEGQLVALRGNHELMMLAADRGAEALIRFWLECGGINTLTSYGAEAALEDIPPSHWYFLKHTCADWYETDTHIFVHANLCHDFPLADQQADYLQWEALNPNWHRPHMSGKTMICGHTQQRSGIPLELKHAVCIDTWAYGGGWLTCLDTSSGDYWQANELGETRRGMLQNP